MRFGNSLPACQRGDMIEKYKILNRYYNMDPSTFFTLNISSSTRGHYFKKDQGYLLGIIFFQTEQSIFGTHYLTELFQHQQLQPSSSDLMVIGINQDMGTHKGLQPSLAIVLPWHSPPIITTKYSEPSLIQPQYFGSHVVKNGYKEHTCVSLEAKLDIIICLKKGESQSSLASKKRIGKSRVGDFKKSEEKIRKFTTMMKSLDMNTKKHKIMRLAEDNTL